MILAAHQPQFAPWLGYFDKLDRADVFVLLDTIQFKKNEWQNRNRIKSATGPQWLTVPVCFRFGDKINEVGISKRNDWRRRHLQSLRSCYGRAPHFKEVFELYESVSAGPWDKLCELNITLIRALMGRLGMSKRLLVASTIGTLPDQRDERLIALCRHHGAKTYLAGQGGRAYMDLDRFRAAGVDVVFQQYEHPSYPQLFGAFSPRLSILDLLFNCGADSIEILRMGRRGS